MSGEDRNGSEYGIAWAPINYFTSAEKAESEKAAIVKSFNGHVLPNLDQVSNALLRKMMGVFPDYDPYADMVSLARSPGQPNVLYFKEESVAPGEKRVIPFTNESGNSVFQYVCIAT